MNVWCSQDLRHLCAKRNLISGMSYAGLVLISEEPKNVSQEACSLSVAVAESLFLSAFGPLESIACHECKLQRMNVNDLKTINMQSNKSN